MLTIHTSDGVRTAEASNHPTLLSVLHGSGVFVDAPCGGNGTCGKCRVYASGALSPVCGEERARLTPDELRAGMRLACRTTVLGDAEVRLIGAGDSHVETEARGEAMNVRPAIERLSLSVPDGSLHDQTDDLTRFLRAAEAVSGHTGLTAARTAVSHLPALLRANGGQADAVTYHGRVLDAIASGAPMLGMAVDIGTTTVVAYFHDLSTGERLGVRSGLNPQRAFGADVISRIAACEGDGLRAQQRAIVGQLDEMAASFCAERGISASSIYHVTVAANTTMLHLLCAIDPKNIANAPFLAATAFGYDLTALELGLSVCPDAPVTLLPCVSSYVGADITAGMAACGLDAAKDKVIYIDIGTNGEMAYIGGGRIVCCATAAGPAFEGAHIECGTGGVPGAVRGLRVQADDFAFDVIGGGEPSGICGSGLVDMVAALLRIGAVDETGRMVDDDELDEPWSARLDDEGDFVFWEHTRLRLTPKDIREVQLAKAAICAGILTLLDTVGETVEGLNRLIVAGGFGAHIRPESACAIGLLPPQALPVISAAGNAAGLGAEQALLDSSFAGRLAALKTRCEYLELSGSKVFQDHYIEQMMFEPEE